MKLDPLKDLPFDIARSPLGERWLELVRSGPWSKELDREAVGILFGPQLTDYELSPACLKARLKLPGEEHLVVARFPPLAPGRFEDFLVAERDNPLVFRDLLLGSFERPLFVLMNRHRVHLLPHPKRIQTACPCPRPDCPHPLALLFALAPYLDQDPQLLLLARGVTLETLHQGGLPERLLQHVGTPEVG